MCPLNTNSPPCRPCGHHLIPDCALDFSVALYKWNHTVSALLWRAGFTQFNISRAHVCCSGFKVFFVVRAKSGSIVCTCYLVFGSPITVHTCGLLPPIGPCWYCCVAVSGWKTLLLSALWGQYSEVKHRDLNPDLSDSKAQVLNPLTSCLRESQWGMAL